MNQASAGKGDPYCGWIQVNKLFASRLLGGEELLLGMVGMICGPV